MHVHDGLSAKALNWTLETTKEKVHFFSKLYSEVQPSLGKKEKKYVWAETPTYLAGTNLLEVFGSAGRGDKVPRE